ncbi:hypothetical protein CONPUDRAFT_160981 [Coniophora puteana RWD-64-598 SS2]|uniref:DUF6533 domain-containing protein n=1 Tax=Coniophora puteana (strain RWD-64-598) TaxID=741705 RepID=A0A5M3N4D1_CONPW|nr:uncharacterized protein CONPUDRAFT_160981 [Coniophora puteana RWD-64-598 SS2]EIW86156.1 hypothetical protein CONPUDRAFT_160981 [Coniophora puteana RWD-64-598 SS2]
MSIFVIDDYGKQSDAYANLAGLAVLAFDYCITLDDEVRWVWGRKWDAGRCIFTLARYFPFPGLSLTIFAAFQAVYFKQCNDTVINGYVSNETIPYYYGPSVTTIHIFVSSTDGPFFLAISYDLMPTRWARVSTFMGGQSRLLVSTTRVTMMNTIAGVGKYTIGCDAYRDPRDHARALQRRCPPAVVQTALAVGDKQRELALKRSPHAKALARARALADMVHIKESQIGAYNQMNIDALAPPLRLAFPRFEAPVTAVVRDRRSERTSIVFVSREEPRLTIPAAALKNRRVLTSCHVFDIDEIDDGGGSDSAPAPPKNLQVVGGSEGRL